MNKCGPRSHCLVHWAGWYLYDFFSTFAAFKEFHWTSTGYLKSCLIVHLYEQMWPQKPPFGPLSRVIFIWFLQYFRCFWGIPLTFNWISKELLNCALLWANVIPEATIWRTEPGDIYMIFAMISQLRSDCWRVSTTSVQLHAETYFLCLVSDWVGASIDPSRTESPLS